MTRFTFHKAFCATLPVMAGYLGLGFAFGIMLADKGYGPAWALLMSSVIYAGSMQFVAITLLASRSSLISAAIMTLMLNARHVFYGISMLEKYRGVGRTKPYLIFSLTDETYALLCAEPPLAVDKKLYYFLVSLFDHCYWIFGSMLGGLTGSLLTFDIAGIDFVMTALFVVIFLEQLLAAKDRLPAYLGVGISLLCLLLFGPDRFLIPSMLIIMASLILLEPLRKGGQTHG